ncbi:MAG: hypothetical protein ABIP44_01725 [Pseudoxanthomonas sp.]
MTKDANLAAKARDERLAARLRENLKRRKQQARAIEARTDGALPKPSPSD